MDMAGVFESLEKEAAQSIKQEDDDYTKDGLLYCGQCHTPKQVRVEVFGQARTPMCLCKCAKERHNAEEAERKERERLLHIKNLRVMGFPDFEMQDWTFDNDDRSNEQLSTIAHNFVDKFDEMKARGKGLLLYGTVGTGKTFISACIANALIEQGHPCMVTNFARLTNTLSGMHQGKQEYIDRLNRFDLLVIDDLASERDTEYMGEIVQNIIDARYRSGLPLIITTNLTSQELKHPADMRRQRVFSRLFEMCVPYEVEGKDRRKEKLKQEFDEVSSLLGIERNQQ